jgi:hypothetical protein
MRSGQFCVWAVPLYAGCAAALAETICFNTCRGLISRKAISFSRRISGFIRSNLATGPLCATDGRRFIVDLTSTLAT